MKSGSIAQIVFIVFAALAVYGFVGAAQRDQRRTSCTALCAFAHAYAGRNRMAPDFELKDMNGHSFRFCFAGMTLSGR